MAEIQFVKGDLFKTRCQTLVNPVNGFGVMGAGLALEFKRRYPDLLVAYQEACRQKECRVGRLFLFKTQERWILNFPTKHHYSTPSQKTYIAAGLNDFVRRYRSWGITSAAFPALGCGLGGLTWKEIRPLMVEKLSPLDIPIKIYLPFSTPPFPQGRGSTGSATWNKSALPVGSGQQGALRRL